MSSFSNLPEVITRELLRQFKDSAVTEEQLAQHRQLALQIGFCHLLGFGLPKQPQIALEYVLKASQMGLPSAQAVAFRLHSLLQQPIEPVACKKWLRDSAMNGSWIAAADYRFLFAAEYHEMNSEIIRKFREQLKQEIEPHTLPRHASLSCGKQIASASMDLGGMSDHLFNSIIRARDKSPNFMKRACLNGDLSLVNLLLQQGADLLQGEQGDNAFHWLIGIDDMDAPDLAERIRQASAVLDINAATYHEIQLSAEPCYFGVMPGGTTPLLWAIARDRWTLVQALLDLGATMPLNIPNSKRLSGINPITWAIQHRALDCLIHLLDQDFSRRHDYINAVDEHEHSPLFYALNSDWKCRLLCTNREPESSYVELEDNILHALIAHGQKSAISLNLSFDQPQAAVISDLHLFQTWSETVGLNDIFFRKETIHGVESQRTMISEAMLYGRVDIFSYMMATLRGREDELQDVISSSAECLPTTFLAQTILDEELLHLCVHAPTAAGVSLALQILDLCPESIDSRDSDGQTPLFKALALGQILLAEVLVERGAGLEVVDNSGCTPLGYAVAQQSIGGVQYLAGQLEKLERPLMAYPKVEFDDTLNPLYWLRGSWFSTTAPVFGYYSVSCLDYIATVEWHDSEHRCDLDRSMYVQDKRTHMHPGCLKLPPTMAFWRILDILLRFELPRKKQRPSIWSSSKQRFFSSDTVTSGLWHGVRYLNEPYVRKVVKSRKFNPEYRVLLDICCRPGWRSINYWHEPEPLEKRSRIIAGYLESQLEEDFRRQRKLQLRTSRLLPARILAKLYYVCYANNHMAAFLRWHKWRIKNAPSVKNPLEFREQNHLPIPFAWFFRLLVWSITLSWMAFVLRIWNDEYTASTEWSAGTQGFGLVYTMLMVCLLKSSLPYY